MADGHTSQHQDAAQGEWIDLGSGWARNERGDTVRTVTEIEDVVAEHSFGGAYCNEPFTRLTKRRLWADGGTFIANLPGHLPQGHTVKFSHHSCAYRLKLVAAQAEAA